MTRKRSVFQPSFHHTLVCLPGLVGLLCLLYLPYVHCVWLSLSAGFIMSPGRLGPLSGGSAGDSPRWDEQRWSRSPVASDGAGETESLSSIPAGCSPGSNDRPHSESFELCKTR